MNVRRRGVGVSTSTPNIGVISGLAQLFKPENKKKLKLTVSL
jgi:hypothetical protein